jgi:hypothetical protein
MPAPLSLSQAWQAYANVRRFGVPRCSHFSSSVFSEDLWNFNCWGMYVLVADPWDWDWDGLGRSLVAQIPGWLIRNHLEPNIAASGRYSCFFFFFGKSRVQVSACKSATLTEVFRGSLQSLQATAFLHILSNSLFTNLMLYSIKY